ncbi:glycosyltransferase family 4 protein [Nocardioides marmoraquaticus]
MSSAGPVVFLHSSDELYGADRVVLDLYRALPDAERATAEVWLPTDVEHGSAPLCSVLEAEGAIVRHLDLPVLRRAYQNPRGLAALARRAIRLRPLLRAARPSMVYCTTSATMVAAPVALSVRAPRVVGHVQELWSRSDTVALSPMALSCQRLVAISSPVRESLPARLRHRTTVVLNATAEPTGYSPPVEHDGPVRFLVASRWNTWKGHKTLLRAWDRAGSPGTLTVLGGPPPSGDGVDVRALVDSLRRPETVLVLGEVPDIGRHVDRADVVVVPSDRPEPFGLVAIEAFARGRPVIASAGGGLADVVSDGVDGWLYEPGNDDALGRLLQSVTAAEAAARGARARETYLSRFTASRYADQWRQVVELVGPVQR